MLQKDPQRRISPENALKHKFFKKYAENKQRVSEKINKYRKYGSMVLS